MRYSRNNIKDLREASCCAENNWTYGEPAPPHSYLEHCQVTSKHMSIFSEKKIFLSAQDVNKLLTSKIRIMYYA